MGHLFGRLKRISLLCIVNEKGAAKPLFSYPFMSNTVEQQISSWVEEWFPDQSYFLVKVEVKRSGSRSKVMILADTDEGIGIDACSGISRFVGNKIEETNLISEAFTLEVSSPGIDYPLDQLRLYAKNIGRDLKVITTDGAEVKGKLLAATQETITLEKPAIKKKKKDAPEDPNIVLEVANIKKAIVQIKF